MTLFNKLRNQRLEWVQELIQELNDNLAGITLPELMKYFQDQGEDDLSFVQGLLPEGEEIPVFSHPTQDGQYLPILEERVPIRPQKVELQWLSWILSDSRSDWFLDTSLKQKLWENLPRELPGLHELICERPFHRRDGEISEAERKCVRTILQAMKESRALCMDYQTTSGEILTDRKTAPARLEYDPEMDSLYLLHMTLEDTQLHKAKISRIVRIRVLDEVFERVEVMRLFALRLKSRERTARLKVTFERGGLERTFQALAPFAKEAVPASGHYEVTVKYYSFDEERLLRKLLSLGPICTVVSPARLRERVIAAAREFLASRSK